MARYALSILLALLLPLGSFGAAQEPWNAVQKATGWASFDLDGSCTFYEPEAKKLVTWTWEGGVQGEVDLSRSQARPEKWVLDSRGDAWCVAGTALQLMDKTGKPGTSHTLPAEVGDLAWDARSFVLCYRGQGLYLEKRDLKNGSVVWSYGAKPPKGAAFPQTLHQIAIKEDGRILVTSGASLAITTIDGTTGKFLETTEFSHDGAPFPPLTLGPQSRGAIRWWLDNNIALAAIPASQAPSLKQEGLLIVKLDFAHYTATVLPTGLSEGHQLVGILEKTIVFRTPTAGLAFLPFE